ncbi:MAG: NUDIX hydrolase [Vampirovibrionales bacterium]
MPEVLLTRDTIFSGKVVRLEQDTVRFPNGDIGTMENIRHPGGVVILPLVMPNTRTPQEHLPLFGLSSSAPLEPHVVLIKQYRYVLQEWIYELPAGKLEWPEGIGVGTPEAHAHAAERELIEEIGHNATEWTYLGAFFTVPGFCDEKLYAYAAQGLFPDTHYAPDANEEIQCEAVPWREALAMAGDGRIQDAKTLACFLLAQAKGLIVSPS